MSGPALVWLRDDLRLDDQPAIAGVADWPSLFVYVHDASSPGLRPLGGASRWWLDKSLAAFRKQIASRGGRLDILRGPAETIIPELARTAGASHVYWTRHYGAAEIGIDRRTKAALAAAGVLAKSFNGQLLREPWEVRAESGAPFKVFTAFWRRHGAVGAFPPPLPAPERLVAAPWPDMAPARVEIADLGLAPVKPDWSGGLAETWRPGEEGARARTRPVRRRRARRLCRGARSARRIAHLDAVAAFALRRDFAATRRRRHRGRRGQRRGISECGREIHRRARLARVFLLAALRVSRAGHSRVAAALRGLRLSRRRPRVSRMDARADGLSARRRRDARARGDRLYAQSRSHDRRVVSDQASPGRLAARQVLVLGHAVRRGPRQQRG